MSAHPSPRDLDQAAVAYQQRLQRQRTADRKPPIGDTGVRDPDFDTMSSTRTYNVASITRIFDHFGHAAGLHPEQLRRAAPYHAGCANALRQIEDIHHSLTIPAERPLDQM